MLREQNYNNAVAKNQYQPAERHTRRPAKTPHTQHKMGTLCMRLRPAAVNRITSTVPSPSVDLAGCQSKERVDTSSGHQHRHDNTIASVCLHVLHDIVAPSSSTCGGHSPSLPRAQPQEAVSVPRHFVHFVRKLDLLGDARRPEADDAHVFVLAQRQWDTPSCKHTSHIRTTNPQQQYSATSGCCFGALGV